MRMRIRVPLRHPFYPEWVATPARAATEECPVISGSFAELLEASASELRPTRAVLALRFPDSPFMSDQERDALWAAFQVPVLALLLDRQGRLAGWECEAQAGLHVGGAWTQEEIWAYRLLTSVAELDNTPCECGRPGQRLRAVPKRDPAREARAVRASVPDTGVAG